MGATRYASVLGLGFGDCGKGHFVDALARRWQAHTVVRFNGGAQAGHNVVTSNPDGSNSRHHTFSQFGAGTLVPGVRTILADPTIVHPTALLVEAAALGRIGVHDALSRLKIDARCRVTTPYHQAAGRLRERLRGAAAHGTCGVGFGETVRHALEHPDEVLRYADLRHGATNSRSPSCKVHAIRETLLAEFSSLCVSEISSSAAEEFQALRNERLGSQWLTSAQALARQCPPSSTEEIADQLRRPGAVLFEGAQGVLLDELHGFHPYTTWSSTTTAAVDGVAARFGIPSSVEHFGVLRSYLTRHGPGPFPTHDPSLDERLPEPHNDSRGWQGPFRRGHPDGVLLRYALEAAGELSGLFVSHLDVFQHGVGLQWCERYSALPSGESSQDLTRISVNHTAGLTHQAMLTEKLLKVQPIYSTQLIKSAAALLDRISRETALQVVLRSDGPTCDGVRDE